MGSEEKIGFEVVTPDGVRRRVEALDAAWSQLKDNPDVGRTTQREYKAWRKFHDDVLSDTASQWWATGTLNELDAWGDRYKAAYDAEAKKHAIEAPSPLAVQPAGDREDEHTSWGWYFAAFGIGAAIAALVSGRKGS